MSISAEMASALFAAFAILEPRWPRAFGFTKGTSDHDQGKVEEWGQALLSRSVSLKAIPVAAQRWYDAHAHKDRGQDGQPPRDAAAFARFALEIDLAEFRHAGRLDLPAPTPPPAPVMAPIPGSGGFPKAIVERLDLRFGEAKTRKGAAGAWRYHAAFSEYCMRFASDLERRELPGRVSDTLYEKAARAAEYDGVVAGLLGQWRRVDAFWAWWMAQHRGELQQRIADRLVSEDEIIEATHRYEEALLKANPPLAEAV